MTFKIKLGFVGLGFIAQNVHLPIFNSLDNVEIVGVCDFSADLAKRIAMQYGISRYYSNLDEFLAENLHLDGVILTVARERTYELSKKIISNGIHLFTEKPISLTSNQGRELQSLSQKSHTNLYTGYMKTHDIQYKNLKSILKSIDYSGFQSFRFYCHMGESYCRPLPHQRSSSQLQKQPAKDFYEIALNTFSHITYVASDLLDTPFKLSYYQLNSQHTAGFLVGTIKSIPAVIEFSTMSKLPWMEGIQVITSNKRFTLSFPPALLRSSESELCIQSLNNMSETRHLSQWNWSFVNQAKYFVERCCGSKYSSSTNLELSCQQLELFEKISNNG